MADWRPSVQDLKRYPHFDKYIALEALEEIATDPDKVARNPFYPFIKYNKTWRPFRNEESPAKKERQIRYASRRDAYIFSYYRHCLSILYEEQLNQLGIGRCPIAYRRLAADDNGGRGKCNIDYARDVFRYISRTGDCVAVALDISSYFESIDHEKLRKLWCRLLKCNKLLVDHEKIFKAITSYTFVDRDKLYKRLGYIGPKEVNGSIAQGYLTKYSEMPMQLCSPREFREKICGKSHIFPSILETNMNPYGIPQGAPISDLLANLYLVDFDKEVNELVSSLGGIYHRYSDDIIVVAPSDKCNGIEIRDTIIHMIYTHGEKMSIKKEKTSVVAYKKAGDIQTFKLIEGTQGRNGLEYLGFRFDGRYVYIRDSTLSAFYRRIAFAARREARKFVVQNHGKTVDDLVSNFKYDAFIKKFGRVKGFGEHSSYRDWTFWTYARRAADIMGPSGRRILRQISKHRANIRRRLVAEIRRAAINQGCNSNT